jgi:superfamily II DNA or RNA helicase
MLQLVKKRLNNQTLTERKETKRIIFATYGMFGKAVDVPRLSAGIDLTPRSRVVQVHGRILRVEASKKTPIWVTLRDFNSYKAEYQFLQRLGEYDKSNGEVHLWLPGKGKKRKDLKQLTSEVRKRHKLLKEAVIQTDKDGRNTVMIPSTEKAPSSVRGNRTAKPTRKGRAR